MNAGDLTQFTQVLTSVCVLYGKPVSEMLIELYWLSLQRFELVEVKAAFQAHIGNPDTGQFMPKPADIVRYLEGDSQTKALLAWSKVTEAMHRIGGGTSVVFDDPLIHAVIEDMGGWVGLCRILLKDLPFRAHEFEKRYVGYLQNPPAYYPEYLVGHYEAQNRMNGYPVKPPLLFGHKERALAVFQSGNTPPVHIHELTASPIAPSLAADQTAGSSFELFTIRERENANHF
jgi:hypothetical protein